MPGKVVLQYKDFAHQTSNFEFWLTDITGANLAAQTSLVDAVITAIEGISLGRLQKSQLIANVDEVTNLAAVSASSRRELKWLLTFADSVDGHIETKELPMVNTTDATLFVAGTETADLTDAAWVSFQDAIQDVIKSNLGNTMILTGARLVGRNL